MKVLIACEYSGRVREAFRAKGHDAWSVDLLPTEIPGQHIEGDVLKVLNDSFDLMVAHPPCTYLAKCGLHYIHTRADRWDLLVKGFNFVKALWESPIQRICIENPAGYLNTNWMKPMQIIQPYYFGEDERKETCLWLKNLPPLFITGELERTKPNKLWVRKTGNKAGQMYGSYWRDNKKAHDRSRTFQGIATAMAEQWG